MPAKQEIIALSQDEYRLKVTSKSDQFGISHDYIVIDENDNFRVVADYEIDKLSYNAITSMPRFEWNKIMPYVKHFCKTYWLFKDKKYTLKLEKAFSYNDVVILYFEPSKLPGTLNLAQLKKKLKSAGIPVVSVEQDKQYHKYGGATKYYRFYVLKKYKGKVDSFIKHTSDNANISYDPPSY